MTAVSVIECYLLDRRDRLCATVEDVGGDMPVQSAVLMLVIVPVEEQAKGQVLPIASASRREAKGHERRQERRVRSCLLPLLLAGK